jgi:hypothetical protein
MKLELLTNATVVDDAIKFVTVHVAAVSSNIRATHNALKDKINTVEEIREHTFLTQYYYKPNFLKCLVITLF